MQELQVPSHELIIAVIPAFSASCVTILRVNFPEGLVAFLCPRQLCEKQTLTFASSECQQIPVHYVCIISKRNKILLETCWSTTDHRCGTLSQILKDGWHQALLCILSTPANM